MKQWIKAKALGAFEIHFVAASTQNKIQKCWHVYIKNQIAFSKMNSFLSQSVSNCFQALNFNEFP